MSFILEKGKDYNAEYASSYYPVLSDDWSGSISFYTSYPGTPVLTKQLVRAGNVLVLHIPATDVQMLIDGSYTTVSTISNALIGVTVNAIEPATVTSVDVSGAAKTILSMTVAKVDGTPAGKGTRELVNTDTGTTIVLGWKGVTVTASHPIADEVTGTIIGTETISTETNAAGYAQLAVIKGQTVTVSCPSFGKTVTVDTTGLDSIDLSSYF